MPAGKVRVLPLANATRDPRIVNVWQRLFERCDHPNALHASPAWAEYLRARGAAVQVAVIDASDGAPAGVIPIVCHAHGLDYSVGKYRGFRSRFRVADALGSLPLVPDGVMAPGELVHGLLAAWPDCDALFFESLPVESAHANVAAAPTDFVAYQPSNPRVDHLIDVDGSFEGYLAGRSAKLRFNAERSLRKLGGVGPVEFKCYRATRDVDRLFADAERVRSRSWQRATLGALGDDRDQSSHAALTELAQRGLLRSYVLYAGGTPCAFVVGYQCQGVYFYAVVGYDVAFARHSPGTALLASLLEDLFRVDRPRVVSFGRGDDDYKRRFGTRRQRVGTYLFFRPTVPNRLRVQQHRLFVHAKELVAAIRAHSPHRPEGAPAHLENAPRGEGEADEEREPGG